MANRGQRKVIAKETLSILENGFYTSSKKEKNVLISDKVQHCNANSRVYNEHDIQTLLGTPRMKLSSSSTKFEMASEYSITSCLRVSKELSEQDKIVCLNFASAKNVCGGMVGGSLAQEESLGLCSTLYSSLSQFMKEYYDTNKKDPRNGLYNNIMIYSQDCIIIRDDKDFSLLDVPVKTSFISAPAVNKGVAIQRDMKPELISATMAERIHSILAIAAENNHNILILGAWGCGVFKNEPHDIALQFAKCLKEPNGKFYNVFERVIFAVGKEERQINAFGKYFSS